MYWWHQCAELVGQGKVQRFGLITSNSIRQSFSRKVIESAFAKWDKLTIRFVIPDHPWVDATDGAAVRVALSVVDVNRNRSNGTLVEVIGEESGGDGEILIATRVSHGTITPNLSVSFDPGSARPLAANSGMACVGYQLTGKGFVLDEAQRRALFPNGDAPARIVRPLLSGRDITQSSRNQYAIDLYGLDETEARRQCPVLYQWVLDRVKPERMQNNRASLRERWWIFGEARSTFRPALKDIARALATSLTAKYRTFVTVPADTICDSTTVMFALPDALHLGILSSRVHETWALAAGGRLGVGNDPRYNKSRCFETFPFPGTTPEQSEKIRHLAEQLDAHRKRQQEAHPGLTLTGMYNVLEKLRSGEELTAKERTIHEQGLVSVLRQLHDELDEAVLNAYGWGDLIDTLRIAHGNVTPPEGTTREDAKRSFDETVLERLVALNAERAAEEARGHIRWLRPEFQNPQAAAAQQQANLEPGSAADTDETPDTTPATIKPVPWPKDTVDQIRAIADLLAASPTALTLDDIAARFSSRGAWKKRLPQLLEMLTALGRATEQDGRFSA